MCRRSTPAEAGDRAGLPLRDPAWFYPGAGWVDPAGLARAYLQRAGARARCAAASQVDRACGRRPASGWELLDAAGAVIAAAATVVLANAGAALPLLGSPAWPLERVRGQISVLHDPAARACACRACRSPAPATCCRRSAARRSAARPRNAATPTRRCAPPTIVRTWRSWRACSAPYAGDRSRAHWTAGPPGAASATIGCRWSARCPIRAPSTRSAASAAPRSAAAHPAAARPVRLHRARLARHHLVGARCAGAGVGDQRRAVTARSRAARCDRSGALRGAAASPRRAAADRRRRAQGAWSCSTPAGVAGVRRLGAAPRPCAASPLLCCAGLAAGLFLHFLFLLLLLRQLALALFERVIGFGHGPSFR